eukprot:s457_g8.t1
MIDQAKADGGEIHSLDLQIPTDLAQGYYVPPTVLSNVPVESAAWKQEIFGPVLAIRSFRSEEEAVRLANDTPYGLANAVYSVDADRLARVASQLKSGIVWENCSQVLFPSTPFGGKKGKASGFGFEQGLAGLKEFLAEKTAQLQLADLQEGLSKTQPKYRLTPVLSARGRDVQMLDLSERMTMGFGFGPESKRAKPPKRFTWFPHGGLGAAMPEVVTEDPKEEASKIEASGETAQEPTAETSAEGKETGPPDGKGKGKGKEKKKTSYWISWDSLERRMEKGRWVAISCSKDHSAKIWELHSHECRGTLAGLHEGAVRCAVIDWKELTGITGADDGTMVLWNLDRYECKEQWLSGKFGQQICVAADWENQRAVSGTAQGKLLLWDSKKLALISAVDAHPGARINKVFIDVIIGFAVTAAEDGRLRVWDVTVPELTCIGTFDKHGDSITALAVDFNKNRVFSGAADGSLCFWHLKTRASIGKLDGHEDKVNAVALDVKKGLAVSASDDETARVWDVRDSICLGVLEGHTLAVRDVVADFDQQTCITCSDDTTLRMWDMVDSTCLAVLEGHSGRVTHLRANWKKQLLLSGSDDYTLRVWDIEKRWCEETLYGHSGPITMLC